MTKSSKRTCLMQSVFSAFFVVATALCAFVSLFVFIFGSTFVSKEVYVNAVKVPAFSEKMMGFLREEMEAECLFYDVPFSVLDRAVSLEEVARFSYGYTESIYESLVHGESFQVPTWDRQPFVDAVQSFFDSLPPEEKPLDKTAAITVGEEFSERALSLLKAGIQEKYLRIGYGLFSHPLIVYLLNKRFAFLAITFVCFTVALFLGRRDWKKRVYVLCFALGISSAALAIPFWLLKRYDFMNHISLMESPLKLYIETIYEAILQRAVTITSCVFVAAAILFVISITVRCISISNKDSTQNVHTNSIDELA